ncbi:MAG: putative lipid II flippase FtsW [Coriobacteriia bacterium]|nr:putative lipid II flippase FtsW [Coriobacteriia bacterium]MCL2750585.1 putative lipid II flippase FtsW [Coriobacteriia bacterium]
MSGRKGGGKSSSNGSQAKSLKGNQGATTSVIMNRAGFLIIVGCLLIFGLVMLYSASSISSYNLYGDYTAVFFRQTVFIAIGVGIVLLLALIPYQRYALSICAIALGVTIILLILVLLDGSDALGARRWIDLGFTTLQPSEFAKIALMLVMAHLVDRCRENGYSKGLIGVMILACIIPIGLIIIEPDLGTTIIAVVGILAVLWFGGVPKRIVVVLVLGLALFAVIAIIGSGFRLTRITAWLDPWSDPQASGYQLLNSYYAFGGGGIFGVGLGLSRQKFNWLPQSENDFIFAIVGEELGLIGALAVMLLFVGLVFVTLKIARDAPDALGSMIAGAAGVAIGAQAFLNMLCVVGAMPITGKPLPFFSAGGSSIISTMILVGLILSVSLQSTGVSAYDIKREQFSLVRGGKRQNLQTGGVGSILSGLPNPAALVGALIPRQNTQERWQRPSTRPAADKVAPATRSKTEKVVPAARSRTEKVVPISRGRADKVIREKQALQQRSAFASTSQDKAPVSMASLRRNRVKRSAGGGNSA